jgi:hypothetical protein
MSEGPPVSGWFIYWRTRAAQVAEATAAVLVWQRTLREGAPGLQAAVWQREDAERPGECTLMEVYTALPAALADAVAAGGPTLPWRVGPRHVERFRSVPDLSSEGP